MKCCCLAAQSLGNFTNVLPPSQVCKDEVFERLVKQSETFATCVESLAAEALQEDVYFFTRWAPAPRLIIVFTLCEQNKREFSMFG
ncbi:hypothetical protein [Spirosoma jeollabukense]